MPIYRIRDAVIFARESGCKRSKEQRDKRVDSSAAEVQGKKCQRGFADG
jgi:hypothetical protein